MTAPAPGAGVSVDGIRISLASGEHIVDGVSLKLAPGEVLGLVGESGSGKTTTALALLGYTAPGVSVTHGTVTVADESLLELSTKQVRARRGRVVSYVPQDPATSLNPARRIGQAIEAMIETHLNRKPTRERIRAALSQVHLPESEEFARRFPHQLSGGQQQRVAIGVAVVCEPPIVVLDEPTTGLDVVTQARVIDEVQRLRRERGIGLIYVSHDLAVVSQVADRVAVMYAGRVVEQGATEVVLNRPRHPYTRGLIGAIPDPARARRLRGIPGVSVGVGDRPDGCAFAPRCRLATAACRAQLPELRAIAAGHLVRCIHAEQTREPEPELPDLRLPTSSGEPLLQVQGLCIEHGSRRRAVRVVHDVEFALHRGECLALIGESGSGKTTIARCLAGLHPAAAGTITFDGAALAARAQRRSDDARRRIQYVFQNPYDSLNPRRTVRDQIGRPAETLLGLDGRATEEKVRHLLERVRLPLGLAERFPAELSGGERQRVAIARALAAEPDLLICDEITSALDVSVQAAVLELLEELRQELGLSMLFITHDLGVVSSIADRGAVLQRGRICETGPVRQLLDSPRTEYTAQLLDAAPRLRSALLDEAPRSDAGEPAASATSRPSRVSDGTS
ncbi:MAG TPA: ABC transporter ATP-binding protein [Solirubrobacteraceae bacterium]|nr:ABC transporter ATP-binding protein [Solirubrobacteraceae bacterium]